MSTFLLMIVSYFRLANMVHISDGSSEYAGQVWRTFQKDTVRQIKPFVSFHTCATCSKLPSYILVPWALELIMSRRALCVSFFYQYISSCPFLFFNSFLIIRSKSSLWMCLSISHSLTFYGIPKDNTVNKLNISVGFLLIDR